MQEFENQKYKYADYLTWNHGKRYELIDGEVYMMSPAPSSFHQEISGNLYLQIASYLRGKKCKIFAAPYDVRLNADTEDNTVVQPDLSIICDSNKIDARGCKGAPDMVVEILSPATARKDLVVKYRKYLEAGVREYWIVYPDTRNVMVYSLKDGNYIGQTYDDTETISIGVLDDCHVDLAEVFPTAPPMEEPKEPVL